MFHNFFGICRGSVSACVCVYCFWFSISDLMYGWICNVRKLIETKNGAWSLRWGSSQKFVWRILIKRDPIFFYELYSKSFVFYTKKKKIMWKWFHLWSIWDFCWVMKCGKNFYTHPTLRSDGKLQRKDCYLFRIQMKSMKNIFFDCYYY
jgi:hypothetical protein